MPRELKPCGTEAAFHRHRRKGEEPCEPCIEAHAAYVRSAYHDNPDNRAKKIASSKARQRALSALAQRHRAEFDALLAEEMAKEETR